MNPLVHVVRRPEGPPYSNVALAGSSEHSWAGLRGEVTRVSFLIDLQLL